MKIFIVLAALVLLPWGVVGAQTSLPPAKVTAWGQHFGGKVVYRYELQNLSTRPIRRFLIGHYMPEAGDGGAELTVAPDSVANSLWVSEQAAARPEGWGVGLVYPEGSSKFSLEWVEANYFKQLWPESPAADYGLTPAPGDRSLHPGMSVNSVSAVLHRIDTAYVNGHVTVDLGDSLVSVPMVKGDNQAPQVTILAQRINQNDIRGEWAIFQIRIEVLDEFDPAPSVVVDPISSNQLLARGDATMDKNNSAAWNVRFRNVPGRVYSLTVRAADASGNTTHQTFSYQVAR